ncbi:MAG: glycosyltransferase family 1 protein [Bryobacterales bacterium]|nr:glycosyltransferase family 1 protein [Bryobacterales bacterium]
MMRIDILAIGSRGDVQPYIALGLGLQTAGFRVRIVTLGGFEDLVRDHRLEHLAVGPSPQEIAGSAHGRDWVRRRAKAGGFLRGFIRVAGPLLNEGMSDYWRGRPNPQAIVSSPMGMLMGEHVAEKLGVPLIEAQLAPPALFTNYDWDGNTGPGVLLRQNAEASVHVVFNLLMWTMIRSGINAARREVLDLPPLTLLHPVGATGRRRRLMLCGHSPAVAVRKPDWPDWIHVTGYWFLEEPPGWAPPAGLSEFLESGEPPVFIGFGSTPFPNPAQATDMVVRAVARGNRRAVVVAGASGLHTGRLSGAVLSVDSVPHGWLFPRMSAAVHHGGAGVTGAALRAGLPSVVVPVFADQPFWAGRVYALGAGPPPIPARKLTEDNLSSAIGATADKGIRERAADLGNRIRAESGVTRAVDIIQTHLLGDSLKGGKRAICVSG